MIKIMSILAIILFSNSAFSQEEIYGGFLQNKKTKEKIALECASSTELNCNSFKVISIPADSTDPSDWQVINTKHNLTVEDLNKIEEITKIKIKYRIQPNPLSAPIFGLTMIVKMLAEQNRTGGGADLPIEILYGISVPLDITTLIPIAVGTGAVYGVKTLIIGVQKRNVKKAFDALDSTGKLRKLNDKNFTLIKNLIRDFEPSLESIN